MVARLGGASIPQGPGSGQPGQLDGGQDRDEDEPGATTASSRRRRILGKQPPPEAYRPAVEVNVSNTSVGIQGAAGGDPAAPRTLQLDRLIPVQKGKQKTLDIFFANVSSWSTKAKQYYEYQVEADVIAAVETHLSAAKHKEEIQVLGRRYRLSGRPAQPSTKSESGTSGGVLVGVGRQAASYSLGPGDKISASSVNICFFVFCF